MANDVTKLDLALLHALQFLEIEGIVGLIWEKSEAARFSAFALLF